MIRDKCEQIAIILVCGGTFLGLPACHQRPPVGAQPALKERPAAEAIPAAERFYADRADLGNVRRAILELRRAQLSDAGSFDIAWRLSKYNYYLGSHTPEESEKEKAYRDGIEAGKLAIKIAETRPEGHFWLGANYGGSAELSMLTGLAEVDEIRQEMERVIKLDEKFEGGSAYMVLGQTYLEAPVLLGGDRQKAVGLFEKGLRIDDRNAMLHYHLAEAYLSVNRKDDARRQIDKVFAMKPNPNYLPEYNDAVTLAHKLQEKLK
jgi:tetratricopeptide (TPR) repeat protein